MLGRAWLPHYRARVDGAPVDTLQANFGQLAIEVPAGDHGVEIWVDRRPFEAALGASALGALGLGALALFGGRRRRPSGPPLVSPSTVLKNRPVSRSGTGWL